MARRSKKESQYHDSNRIAPQQSVPRQTRKTFHLKDLKSVKPLTKNQDILFKQWQDNPDHCFFLCGSAGTGKTFLATHLALIDLLSEYNHYKKIVIIRSPVQVRDLGFTPGTEEEKMALYEKPYKRIFDEMFPYANSYEHMKEKGLVEFESTSFLRGQTFNDSLIIVDECQNMSFQEINTVATRIGEGSKVFFCGDMKQSDLNKKANDVSGFGPFFEIMKNMPDWCKIVEFKPEDIVRSGFVKSYILQKEYLSL